MSSAPCLPSGRHGLDSFVQYAKTYGVILGTLNRHVIFDTAATSDNCDYNNFFFFYIVLLYYLAILSVGNDVFLPPSLSLFLSFPHSLWGAFV